VLVVVVLVVVVLVVAVLVLVLVELVVLELVLVVLATTGQIFHPCFVTDVSDLHVIDPLGISPSGGPFERRSPE
jgi:hypothetical protein